MSVDGARDAQEVLAELSLLLERMLELARRAAEDGCTDRKPLQAELSALRIRIDEAADELERWSVEELAPSGEEGTTNRVV